MKIKPILSISIVITFIIVFLTGCTNNKLTDKTIADTVDRTTEIRDKVKYSIENYEPNTGKSASISFTLKDSSNVKGIRLSGGNQYVKCTNIYNEDYLLYAQINIESQELNYVEFVGEAVTINYNSTKFFLMKFGGYDWSRAPLKEEEIEKEFEEKSYYISEGPCKEIQKFDFPLDLISGNIFNVR